MALPKAKNHLLMDVAEIHALRFRRVYGYVEEIKYLQEADDIPITVETPSTIQAIVKMWWRHGSLRGRRATAVCSAA